ncbi:putative Prolyl 4-hydroxylase alpha subunit [Quillaja saponaria]|uniref:procollagen-proline 4-dioxygenase n=1 Tax=Quillaja saponaria TaxID=32244 RepID=A0AAD7M4Q4_QUISA|nr:putative Prolyl 4-hydroxylase alpha subunit [Quillaja saponaria]
MASSLAKIVLLAFTCSFASCFAERSRKELSEKDASQGTVIRLGHLIDPNRIDPSRVVQLSWQPRVFLYKGFLSDEECDHLISLSMKGKSSESSVTNRLLSSGILSNIEDDIVTKIEERISIWTLLPKENSKPLQLMHYGLEEAEQNLNYFGNKSKLELSEPLMATVVLYLSNVSRGGEILFPYAKPKSREWSDCTKSKEILRPVKGNAIVFFSLQPNTSPDTSSSHARCPILEGEMWTAIRFIFPKSVHVDKFSSLSDGDECTDEDDSCPKWAAIGECQRNPVFMIGSPDYYGTCRNSCNVC